ncbi:carbon storage regulator CsrA [Schnuerera sp. xch1]|uniref:carbon storage regulator CsrA n=1 Tax=Schnuerera sp. xch1 TaxID=2874283 RepID=UPI001CC1A59F|nr:carbon storage regulator CsrA [Schnuerera sp. xch1]MBZ2174825.1 carbon storage regulator CsrA [Schnuerera sp. xch1]
MLILTRKKDESIIIDGNIEVKIMEIEDGKVRIGIDAPENIDIFRKELYKYIEDENIEASKSKLSIDEVNRLFRKKK